MNLPGVKVSLAEVQSRSKQIEPDVTSDGQVRVRGDINQCKVNL